MNELTENVHKLIRSNNIADIKLAVKIIETNKDNLDLSYIFDMVKVDKKYNKDLAINYISKFELTQGLYEVLMGENNSSNQSSTRMPVDNLTYKSICTFLHKLRKLTGLPFRLPTVDEWTYCCQGGGSVPEKDGEPQFDKFGGFSEPEKSLEYAWLKENSDDEIHEVGQLKPNKMGLYDMSGNCYEICVDEIMSEKEILNNM